MSTIDELTEENRRLKAALPPVPGSKTTLYVVCVVVLCVLTASFVLAITFIRPDGDNTSLITTVVALVTPIVLALLGAALRENALQVDGRLSQLIVTTDKLARAEGEKKGIETKVVLATEVARAEGEILGAEKERARIEESTNGATRDRREGDKT